MPSGHALSPVHLSARFSSGSDQAYPPHSDEEGRQFRRGPPRIVTARHSKVGSQVEEDVKHQLEYRYFTSTPTINPPHIYPKRWKRSNHTKTAKTQNRYLTFVFAQYQLLAKTE
jgi:hypothetical protein